MKLVDFECPLEERPMESRLPLPQLHAPSYPHVELPGVAVSAEGVASALEEGAAAPVVHVVEAALDPEARLNVISTASLELLTERGQLVEAPSDAAAEEGETWTSPHGEGEVAVLRRAVGLRFALRAEPLLLSEPHDFSVVDYGEREVLLLASPFLEAERGQLLHSSGEEEDEGTLEGGGGGGELLLRSADENPVRLGLTD